MLTSSSFGNKVAPRRVHGGAIIGLVFSSFVVGMYYVMKQNEEDKYVIVVHVDR